MWKITDIRVVAIKNILGRIPRIFCVVDELYYQSVALDSMIHREKIIGSSEELPILTGCGRHI